MQSDMWKSLVKANLVYMPLCTLCAHYQMAVGEGRDEGGEV